MSTLIFPVDSLNQAPEIKVEHTATPAACLLMEITTAGELQGEKRKYFQNEKLSHDM